MKYIVTIPNYCENASHLWMLNKCLESLFDLEPTLQRQVIIVDDCSRVDIMPVISKYPVKLMKKNTKSSYSQMINASIDAAKSLGGEALITVNNDIEHQKRFTSKLDELFGYDDRIAVIGCQLFYPTGMTQHGGCDMLSFDPNSVGDFYRGTQDIAPERFVHHVTGAWQAIRLSQNLYYDESFPFSFEDVDFSLRNWETGGFVLHTNQIFHIHHESATRSARVTKRELESRRVFGRKVYSKQIINAQMKIATSSIPLGINRLQQRQEGNPHAQR